MQEASTTQHWALAPDPQRLVSGHCTQTPEVHRRAEDDARPRAAAELGAEVDRPHRHRRSAHDRGLVGDEHDLVAAVVERVEQVHVRVLGAALLARRLHARDAQT